MNKVAYNLISGLIISLSLGINNYAFADFERLKKGHEKLKIPKIEIPLLHRSYIDPIFGTKIMRITSPSQIKGLSRIRHYYSKTNPFNADETKAIMHGSDGSTILYDTLNWEPLNKLKLTSSDPEVQWHPTNPNIFYHMDFVKGSSNVRGFFKYNIITNEKTLLRDFKRYDTARGRLEGNMDVNGRYYALVGKLGKLRQAFVYDVKNNKVGKRIDVDEKIVGDWISVSPSGKYVVMMGKQTSIYDINLKLLHKLPKGTYGHADLCLGENGEDYMVFDGADYQLDGNRNINIVNLKTGKMRKLIRLGWGTTPHVSCRNVNKPGWALISTQGPDRKYPNHDFEIFWLRMNKSAEVRRIAHHHSSRKKGGYFSEQHAVTNKNGTKIIFSSNWDGTESVSDFLITLKP